MNYYHSFEQIQVLKIPIQLELRQWFYFAQFLLTYSSPQAEDDALQACWKAANIQIILKINKLRTRSGIQAKKAYRLQLSPTEKHALQYSIGLASIDDPYLTTILYELNVQLEQFDLTQNNKKRITSGN
ncbi:hypothetical protein [Aureispira anguillae]|uniref:Uncharacterized protein n=1 Tax=Aureispira anguillae TaxID=2864201 RepID=A0A915YFW8_9BACT|nr:hypothetical protein [Aureispira anguillae]BDS12368.1 hypothetical protein AsAng_0030890 [Aureispira anguillae]